MTTREITIDSDLLRVLWACYRYCINAPPAERTWSICYTWALRQYQSTFKERFHQSKLQRLAAFGFLKADDTSRAGKRRYYTIVDPERIGPLLRKWNLE